MASKANATYLKLQDIYKSPSIFPTLQNFYMSQVLNYFIEAVSADSKLKQDVKSLRESSFQMFKAGHVQDICLKAGFRTLIIISSCLPEMRKDKIYSLMIRIEVPTADIQFAKCECAAGMGPKATCKHIASLYYALEDFVRIFLHQYFNLISPFFQTSTWLSSAYLPLLTPSIEMLATNSGVLGYWNISPVDT